MPVETEIKLLGASLEAARAALTSAGAILTSHFLLQSNALYQGNGSREKGLTVRLRAEKGFPMATITVKGPESGDGKYKSREETEARVGQEEAERLLEALGYKRHWTYEKKRETWHYGEGEVTLDELPFIGLVVELEGEPGWIESSVDSLRLRGLERSTGSYPALWEQERSRLSLPAGDMTFEAESKWKAANGA